MLESFEKNILILTGFMSLFLIPVYLFYPEDIQNPTTFSTFSFLIALIGVSLFLCMGSIFFVSSDFCKKIKGIYWVIFLMVLISLIAFILFPK